MLGLRGHQRVQRWNHGSWYHRWTWDAGEDLEQGGHSALAEIKVKPIAW